MHLLFKPVENDVTTERNTQNIHNKIIPNQFEAISCRFFPTSVVVIGWFVVCKRSFVRTLSTFPSIKKINQIRCLVDKTCISMYRTFSGSRKIENEWISEFVVAEKWTSDERVIRWTWRYSTDLSVHFLALKLKQRPTHTQSTPSLVPSKHSDSYFWTKGNLLFMPIVLSSRSPARRLIKREKIETGWSDLYCINTFHFPASFIYLFVIRPTVQTLRTWIIIGCMMCSTIENETTKKATVQCAWCEHMPTICVFLFICRKRGTQQSQSMPIANNNRIERKPKQTRRRMMTIAEEKDFFFLYLFMKQWQWQGHMEREWGDKKKSILVFSAVGSFGRCSLGCDSQRMDRFRIAAQQSLTCLQ